VYHKDYYSEEEEVFCSWLITALFYADVEDQATIGLLTTTNVWVLTATLFCYLN
jgi:hypothetical protein